jgi:hypothetical protein
MPGHHPLLPNPDGKSWRIDMSRNLSRVRSSQVNRAVRLGTALLAGCLSLSACNPFSDPEPGSGVPNYNPPPEGVYYFSRVTSGWAFGSGTNCSLQVVRRPLPTKPGESGNRVRYQDETGGTCVSRNKWGVDSSYASIRLDTVFFRESAGNLVIDSVDHFFSSHVSVSFPQTAFQDSGSRTWEECVHAGRGRTTSCKWLRFSEGLLDVRADTLVFLRDIGLLYYVEQYHTSFHGVSRIDRIRLNRIIRGRDTLDFDGTLAPSGSAIQATSK